MPTGTSGPTQFKVFGGSDRLSCGQKEWKYLKQGRGLVPLTDLRKTQMKKKKSSTTGVSGPR